MSHYNSIKQLEEKNVGNEIEIMLWSDRMDIVALANIKGEVSLHRLTWTRVWMLTPKKEGLKVSDMSWRSDSKILAIAYSSGEVLLVSVETKQVLHVININGNVSCLMWAQEKTANEGKNILSEEDEKNCYLKFVDFSATYLPDIQPVSNYSSTSTTNEENLKTNILQEQSSLNLLAIGTEDGFLHLSIFGSFTCAVINVNEHLGCTCTVMNVHFSDSLDYMFLTIKDVSSSIKILIFSTEIFKSHTKELFVMASKHERLNTLIENLSSTITTITETWENILLEMDTKLSKYASKVPEGGVTADFLDLLMFGIYSDEIEEFLVHDIMKKGVEKFGQTIDMSYVNIQKLILKYVMKIGQNICYHLSELRGLARLEHRYKVLGLDEEKVTAAIASNGSFLVKTGEMQQIINHSMTSYRAFFKWLYVSISHLVDGPTPPDLLKMTQQDQANIAEFLQSFNNIKHSATPGKTSGFIMERLGQYLVDAPLTIPPDTRGSDWVNFLQQNTCVANNPGVFERYREMSLVQQLKHLKSTTATVFTNSECIWRQFTLEHCVRCFTSKERVRMSRVNFDKSSTFFTVSEANDRILFVCVKYDADFAVNGGRFHFSYPDSGGYNYRIVDVKFYSPNVLSLLLEETSRKAFLCQFPARMASDELTSIDMNAEISKQDLQTINGTEISSVMFKAIEGMAVSRFSVSGNRRVCIVLAENKRKVRLFEMEAEEEDEDEGDTTVSMVKDADVSMLESSGSVVE